MIVSGIALAILIVLGVAVARGLLLRLAGRLTVLPAF